MHLLSPLRGLGGILEENAQGSTSAVIPSHQQQGQTRDLAWKVGKQCPGQSDKSFLPLPGLLDTAEPF